MVENINDHIDVNVKPLTMQASGRYEMNNEPVFNVKSSNPLVYIVSETYQMLRYTPPLKQMRKK